MHVRCFESIVVTVPASHILSVKTCACQFNLSLCMRKPTVLEFDQVHHKPVCIVTKAGQSPDEFEMRKYKESYEIKPFLLFCLIMIIHDAIEMTIVVSLLFNE